jgi:hypothetical protein
VPDLRYNPMKKPTWLAALPFRQMSSIRSSSGRVTKADGMAVQPRFSIDGPDWNMSFQRRVGSANRGAIPYVPLDSPSDEMRVLVPLRGGEALWIAVMAGSTILVEGRADDRLLRVEKLAVANGESILQMLDAILDSNQWIPIDTASIGSADDRDAIGDGPLTVTLKNPLAATAQRIAIVPATPALYRALSGLPAPDPTTERDEYGGWRLP